MAVSSSSSCASFPRAWSAGSASACAPCAAMLELDAVTKRFGGLTAVRHVSLRAEPGEIVGIIGPNGAGKTTLFNVISGFYTPDEGRVLLDGHDVSGEPAHQICARGLCRTFQLVKPRSEEHTSELQ